MCIRDRHIPVHGRQHHPQPGRGAKRRAWLPAESSVTEGGVRPLRSHDASAVALYAGTDHADGADGGVQSAPLGRSATVPMAVAEPGSLVIERTLDDAGIDRQHACLLYTS